VERAQNSQRHTAARGRFAKIMAALDDKVMDAKHAKQNIVSSMWHGAFQKEC